MYDNLRCRHCGEVIGVYEPMVAFREGHPHVGSRLTLASGEDGEDGEDCYFHRGCFVERHGEAELGE